MPIPEGFEPIETKGVQKRQKTDTMIITKSADIYRWNRARSMWNK